MGWQAEFYVNGKKRTSYFDNEFDASKNLNGRCDKMAMHPQNSEIPNQLVNKKTSQYKGVYWNRQSGKWHALVSLKGSKQIYGGNFNDELDAAKKANQLCEELGISLQNPTISTIPNQQYQKKEKTSQYIGVYWHKQKKQWQTLVSLKGKKQMYGGHFNDELDAAKKVNELCEKLGIPQQNPTINAIPKQQYQKHEKTSKYKGIYWNKNKWHVLLCSKGQKSMYGGRFSDELEAAKRVNQLCQEVRIPIQNPTLSAIPNQQ